MKHEFGAFELDTDLRVLALDGRELALQPRVFDLLAYLVAAPGRVVSKEELLDRVWAGVMVTESSLQRAVSMARRALRSGGLEGAIRSVPRVGYRFCAEVRSTDAPTVPAAHDAFAPVETAFRARDWERAAALLEKADARSPLAGRDLRRWASALEYLGQPAKAIPVLTRAVSALGKAGAPFEAARSAIDLARIHLERAEDATASGWLSRAEQLLGGERRVAEFPLLLWLRARLAALHGEPELALELATRSHQLACELGDAEAESIALVYRGFFRLSLGDTQGFADQDHAAALALSNDVDPVVMSLIYCNILWSCRTFGDWARAEQWTARYRDFCREYLAGYGGSCQLHHAELLGIRGTLSEALCHVRDALSRLASDAPWSLGDAQRVLGDIHAEMGEADEAMACYDRALALGWDANPGMAMLLLERGDAEAACESLERSLIGRSWWTLQRRGMLQAHLAVASAVAGRRDRAEALIAKLAEQPRRWPAPSVRALTSEASAVLAMQNGTASEAVRHLHLARQLWTSIGARQQEARLRIRIAEVLSDQGDLNGAATELRAACLRVEAMGSERLRRMCACVQKRLENTETQLVANTGEKHADSDSVV